jgi:hypothetical protein
MWNIEWPADISRKLRLPTRQIKTDKMTQHTDPLSLDDLSDRSRDLDWLDRQIQRAYMIHQTDLYSLADIDPKLEWPNRYRWLKNRELLWHNRQIHIAWITH